MRKFKYRIWVSCKDSSPFADGYVVKRKRFGLFWFWVHRHDGEKRLFKNYRFALRWCEHDAEKRRTKTRCILDSEFQL